MVQTELNKYRNNVNIIHYKSEVNSEDQIGLFRTYKKWKGFFCPDRIKNHLHFWRHSADEMKCNTYENQTQIPRKKTKCPPLWAHKKDPISKKRHQIVTIVTINFPLDQNLVKNFLKKPIYSIITRFSVLIDIWTKRGRIIRNQLKGGEFQKEYCCGIEGSEVCANPETRRAWR